MSRLLIGNDFIEDVRSDRGWTGWWVQRLAWFAREGDILVLPTEPDKDFVSYVGQLTGVDPDSWQVVVPPERGAPGLLGPDRLAAPEFEASLRRLLGVSGVQEILALWPDMAVARLARRLGLESSLPGYGFIDQAGGVLVNSKSTFRTVAAGAGVRLPDGAVCTSRAELVRATDELLETGEAVIAKHDWMSGGRGNEILSVAVDAIRPIGARRVVRISGRADIDAWADERWDWISDHGRGRPVVEHYVRDSSAYFTEFTVRDDAIEFRGDGELLSAPYAVGQVMPAQGLESEVREQIIDGGRRLAAALQAMGYRGNLGPDAIVTPLREVLFTEWNGRVTGSTHIYAEIGATVVGTEFGSTRMILERVWPRGWSVGCFADAAERLHASGLAYDPQHRTGVVFTNAYDGSGGVMYCVVAPSADQAWAVDRQLAEVFGASG